MMVSVHMLETTTIRRVCDGLCVKAESTQKISRTELSLAQWWIIMDNHLKYGTMTPRAFIVSFLHNLHRYPLLLSFKFAFRLQSQPILLQAKCCGS